MKNLMLTLAFLGLSGFVAGACGDSTKGNGKNDCEKYAELAQEAMDTACANKDDTCCVCKCWKEGKDFDSQAAQCTCVDFEPPSDTCEGAILEEAQNCLADETTCKNNIINGIEGRCPPH